MEWRESSFLLRFSFKCLRFCTLCFVQTCLISPTCVGRWQSSASSRLFTDSGRTSSAHLTSQRETFPACRCVCCWGFLTYSSNFSFPSLTAGVFLSIQWAFRVRRRSSSSTSGDPDKPSAWPDTGATWSPASTPPPATSLYPSPSTSRRVSAQI